MSIGSDSCHKGFLDCRRSCGGLEIYRGVVANSCEHWLSPPVCLWQLSFVEMMVQCWHGLVATEAELGGESETRRIVEFNCASTSPVWAEWHHVVSYNKGHITEHWCHYGPPSHLYHFMTSSHWFSVPVRSDVKSNLTAWCCQNLSNCINDACREIFIVSGIW